MAKSKDEQRQNRISTWLHERVEKSMPHWDPEDGHVITDEAHLQAVGSRLDPHGFSRELGKFVGTIEFHRFSIIFHWLKISKGI